MRDRGKEGVRTEDRKDVGGEDGGNDETCGLRRVRSNVLPATLSSLSLRPPSHSCRRRGRRVASAAIALIITTTTIVTAAMSFL